MKKWLCLLCALWMMAMGAGALAEAESGPERAPHVDLDVRNDNFATDLHEIMHEADQTQPLTVRLSGYVYRYPAGEDQDVQFAVLRDYFTEENGAMPYGLDCYYEGDLPENDAWVRVVGKTAFYEDADGESYLMLMVEQLDVAPEDQRGSKLVFN
ncbi:MAG: hypothetical protein RSC06_04645 [Clostridia bacterium]